MNTVFIKSGAKDWQIFQQKGGFIDITLKGEYRTLREEPLADPITVWARVMSEDYNVTVVEWQRGTLVDDTQFEVTIKNVPAGGLYRIDTTLHTDYKDIEWGEAGDSVFHIGVGDLYVITGQSNSAGYGKTPAFDPPELGVHLFKNNNEWMLATHPFNDSTHSKHPINSDGANTGHSQYLSFGRYLKRAMNYPIGLIQASLGGCGISRWNLNDDGDLYKNMLDIVSEVTNGGNDITGILWYQGCNETGKAKLQQTYLEKFTEMVGFMRRDFNQEDLPIITMQLNKHLVKDDENNESWGYIREAQRMAAQTIPNVYVMSTLDGGMSDAIHNNSSGNVILGERLARLALECIYKKPVCGRCPNIKKITLCGCEVICEFENVAQQLTILEQSAEVLGFKFYDQQDRMVCAECVVTTPNTIRFILEEEPKSQLTVSFADSTTVNPYVPFDFGTGLPMLAFQRHKVEQI